MNSFVYFGLVETVNVQGCIEKMIMSVMLAVFL